MLILSEDRPCRSYDRAMGGDNPSLCTFTARTWASKDLDIICSSSSCKNSMQGLCAGWGDRSMEKAMCKIRIWMKMTKLAIADSHCHTPSACWNISLVLSTHNYIMMSKIQCLFADHVMFLCERNRIVVVMVAAAATQLLFCLCPKFWDQLSFCLPRWYIFLFAAHQWCSNQ